MLQRKWTILTCQKDEDIKEILTCGAEFIASKMSNKYCCRECERDASRKRETKRKKSVRESEKEAALDKERDAVASRPFLNPQMLPYYLI